MSVGNWGTEQHRWFDLYEKKVTGSYTVVTGANHYRDSAIVCDSSGGTLTVTVPDGKFIGQTLLIVCETAGNNITVSVTHHQGGDAGTATLDEADEFIYFMWTGTEWDTLAYSCASDVS